MTRPYGGANKLQQRAIFTRKHILPIFLCAGSYLPLRATWPIQKVLDQSIPSWMRGSPANDTMRALQLMLGIECQLHLDSFGRGAYSGAKRRSVSLTTAEKIKAVIDMVFVSTPYHSNGGHRESLVSEQDTKIWREPAVREMLSALMLIWLDPHSALEAFSPSSRYANGSLCVMHASEECLAGEDELVEAAEAKRSAWSLPEAQTLVQRFASESYGDKFFGFATALLFRCDMSTLELQREVLSTLVDCNALRLLPPMELLLGERDWYFEAIGCSVSLYFKGEEWFYINLLAEKAFLSCVASNCMIVDVVVHRIARILFYMEHGQARRSSSQRRGLITAVLRRLLRPQGENFDEVVGKSQHDILGKILTWNADTKKADQGTLQQRLQTLESCTNEDPLVAVALETIQTHMG